MSGQTNESNLKNYIKLQMLMKQTCIVLRNLFCQRFELKYQRKWEDVEDQGDVLVNGFSRDVYKKAGKLQKKILEQGDINKFDVTTICQLIQAIDITSVESIKIRDIVQVRNKLAHHPTHETDTHEFESLWRKLRDALVFFGFSENKLNELYTTDNIDGISLANPKIISQQHIIQANQLKEKANEAFRNQNYAESITLYGEAIELPELSDDVLAILYSNRSSAYLIWSNEDDDNIQKARDDAKFAINCRPSWWKGYYRLGCVYEAKKKLDKAIVAYNKALSLDPSQLEVRSARDGCRDDVAVMKRKEHLDPLQMPLSREEVIQKINKRMGNFNLSFDQMNKNMSTLRKTGNADLIAEADVFLAHHYVTGMDDVPKSYEEAARLFAKAAAAGNAEAIYNLAILTKYGQGVKRDIPQAISLLRQAAALPPKKQGQLNIGVAEAQHALGLCYEDGVGVDPNPMEAVNWYKRGSENGCCSSDHNLGLLYAAGKGVAVNIERALQYWKSAASGGNVLAMESLEGHYLMVGDFQQARHWWQCALDNGSATAAQRKETHTANNSGIIFQNSDDENDWHDVKNCIDQIALLAVSNKTCPSGGGFRNFPDFEELFESASKGSITAKNIVRAFDHFFKGMQLFHTQNDTIKMIHEFAESYRIESIVPAWKENVKQKLLPLIESKLKMTATVTREPSDFELDLRVCYISLRFQAMDEMLEFSEISIKRFPNEPFFYDDQQSILGFMQRYSEGLRKANMSLKRFPNCISLLYNKAVHTRLAADKHQETIDAYKSFLAIAPNDHRKVPECYYAMATCYLGLGQMDKCQELYDLGLKAEKEQLTCFLPYESSSKIILTNMLQIKSMSEKIKTKHKSVSATSSNKNNTKIDTNVLIKTTKPSVTQLTNPYRVKLAIAHREWISVNPSGKHQITTTSPGSRTQCSPANLIGLKPITFREIDITKDHVYDGYVLQVTNVEDAAVGPSIVLLLADENHDFQRCFIYNYTQICSAADIQQKLGFGSSYSILNPYMRIAKDNKPGIRIDDPRSVIIHSAAVDQSKKCRFCLTVDNNLKTCAACKRVWYCSKTCQSNDWKLLKHKLICSLNKI